MGKKTLAILFAVLLIGVFLSGCIRQAPKGGEQQAKQPNVEEGTTDPFDAVEAEMEAELESTIESEMANNLV